MQPAVFPGLPAPGYLRPRGQWYTELPTSSHFPGKEGQDAVTEPDPLVRVANLVEAEGLDLSLLRLAAALSDALDGAGVCFYDRPGNLLAAYPEGLPVARSLPDHLALALLRLAEPLYGDAGRLLGAAQGTLTAAVPVVASGRRLATLAVWEGPQRLTLSQQAALRLAAIAAGLALAFARATEEEGAALARQLARSALRSLSYSELVAVHHLMAGLNGDEGLLVASRIADRAGITRSVVVNALRKLASARVIESRSLGKRGTYLRILNRELRSELTRQRLPRQGPAARGL